MPRRRPSEPLAVPPAQLRSLAARLLKAFAGDPSLTPLERRGIRLATTKLRDWAKRDEDLVKYIRSQFPEAPAA